jgi:hypothetical protein
MKIRYLFKLLFLVNTIFALISCGKTEHSGNTFESSTEVIQISSFEIEAISEEDFERVAPAVINNEIPDKKWFLSDETGVTILTTAEDVHFWHNDEISEDYARYSFEGFFGNGQFALVKGSHLEWRTHTLVNLETSERYSFWGKPLFSENGRLIVSYSFDPLAGFMPNGFQVFSITNGIITLLFEQEFEEWGFYEMRWESDSTLVVISTSYNNDFEEVIEYIRVSLK